ncbi:L-histidine N(alpha)-methyltransferase [Galbibacter sp. PAP.153]|uniref:L-histidine N(alpha)-methyltransferase n=1 Tax=Galbibacter sp. PAP.153 TaxID=3104623 RepID=UPI00300AA243
MEKKTLTKLENTFEEDVYKGLTSYPKKLSSKYFYDEKGDKIFQQIMEMPEYYLTNAEYEIIDTYTPALAEIFKDEEKGFDLIELGAGDGKKTKILLQYLTKNNYKFSYLPIDISKHALLDLKTNLNKEFPQLEVVPKQGTYLDVLHELNEFKHRKKVIMMLGSNIGNMVHENAISFMQGIQKSMHKQDLLFMGFDQKKHPKKITKAYSDKTGITEAFNKNILVRINNELDANFNPDKFIQWESYNPETGTAKSFLVATEPQTVFIRKMNLHVDFDAWETIHTEISQKYDLKTIDWIAGQVNLKIVNQYTDAQQLFKNFLFAI